VQTNALKSKGWISADAEFLQLPQANICCKPWFIVWRLLLATAQANNSLFHLLRNKIERLKINLALFSSDENKRHLAGRAPAEMNEKCLK